MKTKQETVLRTEISLTPTRRWEWQQLASRTTWVSGQVYLLLDSYTLLFRSKYTLGDFHFTYIAADYIS